MRRERFAPLRGFAAKAEDDTDGPETPPTPPPRPRLLLRRQSASGPSRGARAALGGGCALLASGGGLLAFDHRAALLDFAADVLAAPDAVATALLASGAALAAAGAIASAASSRAEKAAPISARTGRRARAPSPLAALLGAAPEEADGGARFSFTLLNDDAKFRDASKALDLLVAGGHAAFPEDVRRKLDAATRAQRKRTEAAARARVDERAAFARERLDADAADAEDLVASLRPRVFVVDFDSTEKRSGVAGAVGKLEDVVDLLEGVATRHDEVVLRVKSPGGAVSDFGLAAALVLRLRVKTAVTVTACVDVVAASGGYMLACVADSVVAAPFAFVGSVGVVGSFPNFARALDRYEVDYLEFTGGEYKRTVTPFAPPTEAARRKLQEQIDEVHGAFKDHVSANRRGRLASDDFATGEAWLAALAPPGLVDGLATSGEVLRSKMADADVILVAPLPAPPKLRNPLAALGGAAEAVRDAAAAALPAIPSAGHGDVSRRYTA